MKFIEGKQREILLEMALPAIAVASVALLWRNNLILTIILFVESAVALYMWREKADILLFFGGFVGGPTAEVIAINFGGWTYSNPTLLGAPMWLPFLWGLAVLVMKRSAQTVAGQSAKL